MTEQEVKQQIDASERQILVAYNDLISAAREVGSIECQPIISELSRAVQAASTKKKIVRILSHMIGLAFYCVMVAIAAVMDSVICVGIGLIGWPAIVYYLYRKTAEELVNAEAKYNSMVKADGQVKSEQSHLNSILDRTEI